MAITEYKKIISDYVYLRVYSQVLRSWVTHLCGSELLSFYVSEYETAMSDAFISLSSWQTVAGTEWRHGEDAVELQRTKDWPSNPITGRKEWLKKKDEGWLQILIAHLS